jgi:hypothetical protein
LSKPKFHFLLHIPFFICCFGPAILYSTERYEAYNAVFRAASIYSNHQAPSRDIAWIFAGIDRVKHIVTGGWWRDTCTNSWTHAGVSVLKHIAENPQHAALVGLTTKTTQLPGRSYCPKKLHLHYPLIELLGSITHFPAQTSTLKAASFVTADSVAANHSLLPSRILTHEIDLVPAKFITAANSDVICCWKPAIVRCEGVSTFNYLYSLENLHVTFRVNFHLLHLGSSARF